MNRFAAKIIGSLLGLALLLGGCGPSRESCQAKIKATEQRASESYYASDLLSAETNLLAYKQALVDCRKEWKDLFQYDYGLGLISGRLALLYEHTGQTNKAAEQMRESIAYFERMAATEGSKTPDEPERVIREFIARLDGNRKPAWQTNALH